GEAASGVIAVPELIVAKRKLVPQCTSLLATSSPLFRQVKEGTPNARPDESHPVWTAHTPIAGRQDGRLIRYHALSHRPVGPGSARDSGAGYPPPEPPRR